MMTQLCNTVVSCTSSEADRGSALARLRKHVLEQGLSTINKPPDQSDPPLRSDVWKAFVRVDCLDASEYMRLVQHGPCRQYDKIRKDTCRTFKGDSTYEDAVDETQLIRVLNSFVLQHGSELFGYVQGMQCLCGAMLFAMPEVDAFQCFARLTLDLLPTYWMAPHLPGANAAVYLVDQTIKLIDTELHDHFHRFGMTGVGATMYAFPLLTSLMGCAKPFGEFVQLMDFFLAFGPHFVVLTVTSYVLLLRDELVEAQNLRDLTTTLDQRNFPHLNASAIISFVVCFLPKVKAQTRLWTQIERHTHDPRVVVEIFGEFGAKRALSAAGRRMLDSLAATQQHKSSSAEEEDAS